ncbi:MAG: TatD family hydrolase [Patescibacteria group bacterium]|nr:TatD family hydrolase [Patescibacteria group bacterium]MCX7589681.1 TatD family hydrolase [Patescibacteria group bacterium]MDW8279799.1 TatD family hydrolase [bacterium]
MVKFFDAHTHVQFNAFAHDWKDVLDRAFKNQIGLINVGTNKITSQKALNLINDYANLNSKFLYIYATVGLHPIHIKKSFHDPDELEENDFMGENDFDYEFYRNLALNSKVLGIGECGLDYFRLENNDEKFKQIDIFQKQIKLSFDIKKPLMIHCRNAYSDLIKVLKNNKNLLNNYSGIVHFFSGSKDDARQLLDLGFYFTFGGVITFTKNYNEVIRFIPLNRILSETDAPYVAPVPYRGKRNEPLYVIEVVKKLAEIKNIDFNDLNVKILENLHNLFNINFN